MNPDDIALFVPSKNPKIPRDMELWLAANDPGSPALTAPLHFLERDYFPELGPRPFPKTWASVRFPLKRATSLQERHDGDLKWGGRAGFVCLRHLLDTRDRDERAEIAALIKPGGVTVEPASETANTIAALRGNSPVTPPPAPAKAKVGMKPLAEIASDRGFDKRKRDALKSLLYREVRQDEKMGKLGKGVWYERLLDRDPITGARIRFDPGHVEDLLSRNIAKPSLRIVLRPSQRNS